MTEAILLTTRQFGELWGQKNNVGQRQAICRIRQWVKNGVLPVVRVEGHVMISENPITWRSPATPPVGYWGTAEAMKILGLTRDAILWRINRAETSALHLASLQDGGERGRIWIKKI